MKKHTEIITTVVILFLFFTSIFAGCLRTDGSFMTFIIKIMITSAALVLLVALFMLSLSKLYISPEVDHKDKKREDTAREQNDASMLKKTLKIAKNGKWNVLVEPLGVLKDQIKETKTNRNQYDDLIRSNEAKNAVPELEKILVMTEQDIRQNIHKVCNHLKVRNPEKKRVQGITR